MQEVQMERAPDWESLLHKELIVPLEVGDHIFPGLSLSFWVIMHLNYCFLLPNPLDSRDIEIGIQVSWSSALSHQKEIWMPQKCTRWQSSGKMRRGRNQLIMKPVSNPRRLIWELVYVFLKILFTWAWKDFYPFTYSEMCTFWRGVNLIVKLEDENMYIDRGCFKADETSALSSLPAGAPSKMLEGS